MTGQPDSQDRSDAELAAAYRDGDQQAAADLVLRHADAMGRFLLASGAPEGDLEDLAQEAFFRAFRRIDSWRQQASFRSWLLTIAGNLLRDQYRRNRGRKVVSLDGHDPASLVDPGAELIGREAEGRMRAGLAELPRLQREVFLMRVQEGSGYDEIARALGTTPGAARVHYHHAVKRLKETVA